MIDKNSKKKEGRNYLSFLSAIDSSKARLFLKRTLSQLKRSCFDQKLSRLWAPQASSKDVDPTIF